MVAVVRGGVAFDVVGAVGVDLPELGGCLSGLPVAACPFPAGQFLFRAVDADEDDVQAVEDGEAVQQPPLLAEDVVDDEVVACLGHARDCAVEAYAGPGQCGGQVVGGQLQSALAGAHRVDGIDGHVEEGAIQDEQESLGDARFA